MTNDTFSFLRPTTLAQMAAEIVINNVDDLSNNGAYFTFDFRTEGAANAYRDIVRGLVDAIGETATFEALDQAIAREWETWNDKLFSI